MRAKEGLAQSSCGISLQRLLFANQCRLSLNAFRDGHGLFFMAKKPFWAGVEAEPTNTLTSRDWGKN